MFDVQKFVGELQDYIGKALKPLADRVKALEEREPARGEPGRDGADGRDGQDAPPVSEARLRDALSPALAKHVADWLAANPPTPGADGANGRDGVDGASVNMDQVEQIVAARLDEIEREAAVQVQAAIDALPVPQDGENGRPGADGAPGRDGASITLDDVRPMLEAELAKWALDFERRAQGVLERAVERIPAPPAGKDGRDGVDGKNGRDGLALRHLSVEQVDERTMTLTLRDDERVEHVHLAFPVVIDRGVYREGDSLYEKGDGVSFGGSFWIAQKDAPDGKPGMSSDWRLAVKKGRDGKDGRNGIDFTKQVKP